MSAEDLRKKIDDHAAKADRVGKALIVRLTIPIILFVAGAAFLPFGFILWFIGVMMMVGGGATKKG